MSKPKTRAYEDVKNDVSEAQRTLAHKQAAFALAQEQVEQAKARLQELGIDADNINDAEAQLFDLKTKAIKESEKFLNNLAELEADTDDASTDAH